MVVPWIGGGARTRIGRLCHRVSVFHSIHFDAVVVVFCIVELPSCTAGTSGEIIFMDRVMFVVWSTGSHEYNLCSRAQLFANSYPENNNHSHRD